MHPGGTRTTVVVIIFLNNKKFEAVHYHLGISFERQTRLKSFKDRFRETPLVTVLHKCLLSK